MNAEGPERHVARDVLNVALDKLPMTVIGILTLAGLAINFANVIARYVFGFAFFWAEEILVFIVVWSVFVGAIAITYRGGHLKMNLFSDNFTGPLRGIVNGLVVLGFLFSGIFAVIHSYRFVAIMARNATVSVTAEIPMTVPHSAIMIGFAFIVLAVIVRIRAYLRGDF